MAGVTEPIQQWYDLQFHDTNREQIRKPNEIALPPSAHHPTTSPKKDILDKIRGSLFGLIVGDALGAHVEFRPRAYLQANPVTELQAGGTWGLEKGQFTDDTSMALCLANSLIARQGFVPYDQLVRYKWWYRHGYMSSTGHCFDIGTATRQSIQEFEERQKKWAIELDKPVEMMDDLKDDAQIQKLDVNCSNEGVAGNGALMRLAPVPLFFYREPPKAVLYSGQSGQITHGDQRAIDACRYYGALIVGALTGISKDDLLSDRFYDDHKDWFGNKPLHEDILGVLRGSFKKKGGYEDGIRGKGYVVNALEAALWAFWSDQGSFETEVLAAVNLGDDTDTTAAIYGQLAGAFYGFDKLPKRWVNEIYAKDFIELVCYSIACQGQPSDHQTNALTNTSVTHRNDGGNPAMNSNSVTMRSIVSRPSMRISQIREPLGTIKRKAIDPNGVVGSLYDARTDSIETNTGGGFNAMIDNIGNLRRKCFIKRGDEVEIGNALKYLGFDLEQRLSLLTDLVSPKGIASIIDYPYLIDENTRVFFFSSFTKQTLLEDKHGKDLKQSSKSSQATHLIGEVQSGIDVIVLLRVWKKQSDSVDRMLDHLRQCLSDGTKLDDKESFDQFPPFHVYSNIPLICEQKKIIDLYHCIRDMQGTRDRHWPLTYTLYPLNEVHSSNGTTDRNVCFPVEPSLAESIEEYLFGFRSTKKLWKAIMDPKTEELLEPHLGEQLRDQQQVLEKLKEQHQKEKDQMKQLIVALRRGDLSSKTTEEYLSSEAREQFKLRIDELTHQLNSFKFKADFLRELGHWGFKYSTASSFKIEQYDDKQTIEKKVVRDRSERIICSTDYLNELQWAKFNQLIEQIRKEHSQNGQLRLYYIDFSYSPCHLDEFLVFPVQYSSTIEISVGTPRSAESQSRQNPLETAIEDRTTNILLVGRSQSGKSTLINTFADYVNGHRDASRWEHVILSLVAIPFMFITGTDHEEHIICIGHQDPNEYSNIRGQSLTQQCKSHRFKLSDGRFIQLIDTPGFGDRQDLEFDRSMMKDIFAYVSNLPHLNAICLVIDVNEKQFSDYGGYLRQLWDFLDESIVKNLLICWTKTSSTSHSVLEQRKEQVQSMLRSTMHKPVPLDHQRFYQFDSSYFIRSATRRYTASTSSSEESLQQSRTMTRNSWEALLKYVFKDLSNYSIHHGLQKREHIRVEIKRIVRPLCEALRNLLRNELLYKYISTRSSIQIRPIPVQRHSVLCFPSRRVVRQYGKFYVVSDTVHRSDNQLNCSCPKEEHIPVSYRLDYAYSEKQPLHQLHEIDHFVGRLISAMPHLSSYLWLTDEGNRRDPFLTYLDHLINDELLILNKISNNQLTFRLHKKLMGIRNDYKYQIDRLIQKGQCEDLSSIQQLLRRIKQYPCIMDQLAVSSH